MLLFVILAQAFLFFILDKNSEKPKYNGNGFKGFIAVIMDSYSLSIGDF